MKKAEQTWWKGNLTHIRGIEMVYEIGNIAPLLLVSELNRSRVFYENLLQLTVVYESFEQGLVCYAFGSNNTIILRIRQGTKEELEKMAAPFGQGAEFVLNVGRGYQYAIGPFEKASYPYSWNGCVVAFDPDGYKWSLVG
ncbi:hypothetical protein HCC47_04855 [Streptococcus suis]|nr:hypothetical protein [Streptococcus suis]